jgi:competence protein ComGC
MEFLLVYKAGLFGRRRAFTLIEMLMAGVVSITLIILFWGLMRQSTQASSRMNEVMKLMDGAMIQTRLDDDIRTSMEVIEPDLLVMSSTLKFYNRQYEKVTYKFITPDGKKEVVLQRTCGDKDEPTVIARRLKRGIFYRTGPNLVEYEIDFQPVFRPGAGKDQKPVEISVSSKVFLGNGIY